MSAFRGEADMPSWAGACLQMTQSGHREAEWSGLRRCFRLRSPCDENTADALEHRLAFLISRVDLATKDSRIRPRLGLAFLPGPSIPDRVRRPDVSRSAASPHRNPTQQGHGPPPEGLGNF